MGRSKTRLQRKREKESLKQAVKYLLLIFLVLYLMIKFGLPGLIKMASFIVDLRSSGETVEQQDSLPVMTPQLLPLPEATQKDIVEIAGYGEAGATVQLYIRGISADEAMVDKEGNFSFKDIHLREGENEIYVVARNDKGKMSGQSESLVVVVDKIPPSLTVDQPSGGDKFFDKDSPVTVSGKTEEEGIDLTVNGRFVMVKSDGSWETKVELSEGDNQIEVVAKDKAGNETKEVVKVNYTP
jgi:bacillopeptidase F